MSLRTRGTHIAFLFAVLTCGPAVARAQGNDDRKPQPTHANLIYGHHARHRFDLWLAESDHPTPLVIYIHGGGFRTGSKEGIRGRTVQRLLDHGISVAAVEYRLLEDGVLPLAHYDCRQALQYLRLHRAKWNIDPQRVGAYGGSAGAQLCMWLALHDDMALPDSDDPRKQQSSRLTCVATRGGQTTMDFAWWREHIPGYETPHRPPSEYFGDLDDAARQQLIRDISALSLISADDPPIWMLYRMAPYDSIPDNGDRVRGWQVHHVNFGVHLQRHAKRLGVEAFLNYPGRQSRYPRMEDFLIAQLTGD